MTNDPHDIIQTIEIKNVSMNNGTIHITQLPAVQIFMAKYPNYIIKTYYGRNSFVANNAQEKIGKLTVVFKQKLI